MEQHASWVQLEATARQQTLQWIERAVIGLNLCPFAAKVVRRDQLRLVITPASSYDEFLEAAIHEMQWLHACPREQTDTSILVAPRALPDFLDFNDLLGNAEDALTELGLEGELQIASFHPAYQFADSEPLDVGNHTNRSPYPMLHFLREQSVSDAVDAYGDTQDIIERNQATLKRLGIAGLHAHLAAPDSTPS